MTMIPADEAAIAEARALRDEFQRFLLEYRFGMREIETKISILREEFEQAHDYNPIEHVTSRVKSPDSLVEKVSRKGIDPDFASIREQHHRHRGRADHLQLRLRRLPALRSARPGRTTCACAP